MKSKAAATALALLLALGATAGIFLYVQGIEERALGGGARIPVVVSKVDVPAGTQLDSLLAQEMFTTKPVGEENLLPGAIQTPEQLRGQTTAYPILAGEQISPARLRGVAQAPGGLLGIPRSHQAVTLALEPHRLVGGAVQQGDNVTIYGTFDIQGTGPQGGATVTLTRVLVPEAEVLQTSVPEAGGGGQAASMVTLALQPDEARLVVHGQERGSVYLALLPPNEKGMKTRPLFPRELLR